MKKILGFLTIAATLTACKGTADRVADESTVSSATENIKTYELAKQKERAAARTTVVYRDVNSNTAAEKRGWSSAAKGAVIGGVAGAAAGAIINKKNRAAGAVVGGAAGAGVGYTIGR